MFGPAEIQTNHRECVLVSVVFGVFGDLQAIEPCPALVFQIEECIQHAEVCSLAESAGACVDMDAAIVGLQEIPYEEGLIDIVLVAFMELREGQSSCADPSHAEET